MMPADEWPTARRAFHCPWAGFLAAPLLSGCALPVYDTVDDFEPFTAAYCELTPAAASGGRVPGLIVGADVLAPEGHRPDHGVHIRFNGQIGAVAEFDALRAAYPRAAVLDCRGRAVLSPGFVNAHEHPAFSHAFPDANLNPGYAHRDEWRLGIGGKVQLPSPEAYYYDPGDTESTAILLAMELRHLLGGATAIAGTGGVPGVIRNINRHVRDGDPALYDAEADVTTFPFSFSVVEDLEDECAGGPVHRFPPVGDNLPFMAYVPHVGEGRSSSCAARAEVARYLERAQRRDRRYSLVHGVAADREDYMAMRELDVTLVWSPRSNLALYGETVDIAGALEHGVRVALSTDWSPSGSFNMREEVVCARQVAEDAGVALPGEALWRMATINGAYALGLEGRFGAIQPGLRADLVLASYAGGDAYEAVLTATDEDILATWIDGRAVLLSGFLDESLSGGNCEALDGVAPRVCGVFGVFGLSAERFGDYLEDTVPVNDASGQAACGPSR
ncbi:MAG: amidohydrolase family protein [Proteobacteria bacterium]|nr:amidohydrolase family protein [Pseudomonadota bacterium]